MWVLTDMAGENVYSSDGKWLPMSDIRMPEVAKFETWDEAERVQFVLQWAKQCYTELKEVRSE